MVTNWRRYSSPEYMLLLLHWRFIALAHALGSPYIRVFGDRVLPDQPRAASLERVVSGLRELGAHAPWRVRGRGAARGGERAETIEVAGGVGCCGKRWW